MTLQFDSSKFYCFITKKLNYNASFMINKGMNTVRFSTCAIDWFFFYFGEYFWFLFFCFLEVGWGCFCSSFFSHGPLFFLINNKWPILYFWINKLLQILLFYKNIIVVILLPSSSLFYSFSLKSEAYKKHGK